MPCFSVENGPVRTKLSNECTWNVLSPAGTSLKDKQLKENTLQVGLCTTFKMSDDCAGHGGVGKRNFTVIDSQIGELEVSSVKQKMGCVKWEVLYWCNSNCKQTKIG